MSIEICVSAGAFMSMILLLKGSIKSFMIFKSLTYMTIYNIHSYMVSQIGTVKFLL